MYIVGAYLTYLAISIAVTIWVAKILHSNGRVFLVDAFHGNEPLADSVNRLLVTGFYLVNIGWVTLVLSTPQNVSSMRATIELLSVKIGGALLILGFMHFVNLVVFNSLRQHGRQQPRAGHLPAPPPPPLGPPPAPGWTPHNAPFGHVLD